MSRKATPQNTSAEQYRIQTNTNGKAAKADVPAHPPGKGMAADLFDPEESQVRQDLAILDDEIGEGVAEHVILAQTEAATSDEASAAVGGAAESGAVESGGSASTSDAAAATGTTAADVGTAAEPIHSGLLVASVAGAVGVAGAIGAGGGGSKGSAPVRDTTPPVAPTLALAADTGVAGDGITSNGQVDVSGLEAGASWEYSVDAGATWTAGTGTSVTLTGDGAKSVIARQTDAAGNVSANSTALAFTLDTTAPAAPTLALTADTGIAGDGITSNGQINVVGLEAGATWEYSVDAGTTWMAGTGTSVTLTGDGTKSVIARQTDATGNVSANSTALAFTLDTAAPTTTAAITAVADNVAPILGNVTNGGATNDTSLNLSGTTSAALAAGEVIAVYDGATRLGTATVTGTNWTYTDATLVNGDAVSYTVRVEDAAGNRGPASAAFTATIDTVAVAPTLALAADTGVAGDGVTSNGQVNVSGLEAGASWEYSTNTGATWVAGTGTSFTLTGDGAKSVIVRQTDGAGNTSVNSTALAFTLDTNAPVAPTLVLAADTGVAGDGITKNGQVNVTGLEAGAIWEYSVDAGATWVAGTGTSFTLTGVGAKSVIVRQTDAAGNVSTSSAALTFTLDTAAVAPTLALAADTGVAGNGITSNGQVNVTGLEAGATWEYSLDAGTTWTAGTGTSCTLAGDGAKSVIARQTDGAGNVSANSATLAFTLDTNAPVAPTLALAADTGVAGDSITNNGQVNVTGLETGVSWEYSVDAGATWTAGMGSSVTLSGDGAKSVIARQTDAAGNVSANSAALAFVLDTAALPTSPPDLLPSMDNGFSNTDNITNFIDLTFNGTGAEAGATVTLIEPGIAVLGTAVADATGAWSINSSALLDGMHDIAATQTDIAGNVSVDSGPITVIVDTVAPGTTTVITQVLDNYGINQGPLISGVGTTDDTSLDLSGTISAPLAADEVVAVYDGGIRLGSATVTGTNWTYTDTSLVNGQVVNYQACVEDLAGNPGPLSGIFNVTISAPTTTAAITAVADNVAPILGNVTNGGATNDTSLDLSGTISATLAAGEVVAVYDGANRLGAATVTGTNWTYTDTTLVNGDAVNYTVCIEDAAGNLGPASAAFTATIDTLTPVMPTLALAADTGVAGDGITSNGQVNVIGLEMGATWEYSLDAGATWTAGTGTGFTLTGDGAKSVIARQTDAAGNISANSAVLGFMLDTIALAPSMPVLSPISDSGIRGDNITNDMTPTFIGTAEPGATVTLLDGARVSGTAIADAAGTWSIITGNPVLSNGMNNISAQQVDVAGNTSIASAALAVNVDCRSPVVTDATFSTAGAAQSFDAQFDESIRALGVTGLTVFKNGVTPLAISGLSPLLVAAPNGSLTFDIAPDMLGAGDYVALGYDSAFGSMVDVAGNSLGSITVAFGSTGTLGAAGTTMDLFSTLPWYRFLGPSTSVLVYTHQGNDTVTGSVADDFIRTGNGSDMIDGGRGVDTIDLGESIPAMDTVVLRQEIGWKQSWDTISGFDVNGAGAAAANNDRLDLPSNTIAAATTGFVDGVNAGTVMSHSIGAGGIVTFGSINTGTPMLINSSNLNSALTYLRTNLADPGATVAFGYDADGNGVIDGTNDSLIIYQDAGAGWDIVPTLSGIGVATSTLGTVAGQNVIQLWDHTAPVVESASFGVSTISLTYSENIQSVAGTAGTILLNGTGASITTSAVVSGGNMLNVTTGSALAQTDWLLMNPGLDVTDLSGNAGQVVALGGSGDNVIDVTAVMNVASIMGGAGNDTITGTANAEQIIGGAGADTINSGGGADTFIFSQGDSPPVIYSTGLGKEIYFVDPFYGGPDVISGIAAFQSILIDQSNAIGPVFYSQIPGQRVAGNQECFDISGAYSAATREFTVGVGGGRTSFWCTTAIRRPVCSRPHWCCPAAVV